MKCILALVLLFLMCAILKPQSNFEKDIIKTYSGDLKITFIGHGT